MKTNRILMAVTVILIATTSFGQKIKVTSGKITALEDVVKMKIEYDYSNLGVGKFEIEDEYIEKKVTDMNKDEAGTGDQWKEAWFNDRSTRYEPKFEELFAKHAPFIESGQDVDAEVTMHVHTTFIEPGFNVGVARKPAYINLEVGFLKGGEELVNISILNSPGSGAVGFDFDAGYRISEAYAKAGKSLAQYLVKNLL
jgi:hypothetical protein